MANYYLGDNGELVDAKKKKNKKGKNYTLQSNGTLKEFKTDDIAPVKETKTQKKTDERTWFQSGAFSKIENPFKDGWDKGDLNKWGNEVNNAIRISGADLLENIGSGILGIGEKLADAGAMLGTAMNEGTMAQSTADMMMANSLPNC